MAKKEKIFNDRKRKVFRKRIPSSEVVTGAGVALFLLAAGGWFFAQADNYDPNERDISTELMAAGSVEDKLYRTPLAHWVDPRAARTATADAAPDLGIFPAGILDGGWQLATRIQEFDESNVYEKINGAAPQYQQYGFQRLHFVGLEQSDAGVSLSIEIYDQATFPNALGIFSAQRGENRKVERSGHVYFYNTEIGALGLVGPYYFKVTGDSEAPAIQEKAQQLVQQMAALLKDATAMPAYFTALQQELQVPFENITFEKSDVFQYQFATDFWFGAPGAADGLRYFIHEAESEEAAAELFQLLQENLLFDFEEATRTDNGVVLKHKFLETFFIVEQDGKLVYGAESVPDLNQVDSAAAQLRTALLDEAEQG